MRTPLVDHGTSREMRWESMRGVGYLTPTDRFFVRNHTRAPDVDVSRWRLQVSGSGVRRPLSLSYDDVLALPDVTVTRALECAGNGRRFYGGQGREAPGTPWALGAIGVAAWTGVRLADVLDRAGLQAGAVDVMAVGLDELAVRRPIPVAKALEADTLVVYGMNGEVLPVDHGFPVRLLVPGWAGIASIKWLGGVEVADHPLSSPWNTTSYVLTGADYPDEPVVNEQVVKSALELPWPATLPAGTHVLTGRSWSGTSAIAEVRVSVDGGRTWRHATLGTRNVPKAWAQWTIEWDAPAGEHQVRVRATDRHGHAQPDRVAFNDHGYLYGAVVDHPVTVV